MFVFLRVFMMRLCIYLLRKINTISVFVSASIFCDALSYIKGVLNIQRLRVKQKKNTCRRPADATKKRIGMR